MTRMIVLSIGQVTWQGRNVFNFCLVIIILCCMYTAVSHVHICTRSLLITLRLHALQLFLCRFCFVFFLRLELERFFVLHIHSHIQLKDAGVVTSVNAALAVAPCCEQFETKTNATFYSFKK